MSKAINIMVVEDNPGDIELIRDSLSRSEMKIGLNIIEDGLQALHYLRKERDYGNAERPDIILLDLNLPGKHGHEVLREIKGDRSLKSIPVMIFTTSDSEDDVAQSYNLGANCHIIKPPGIEEFHDVMSGIESFWLSLVRLPSR